MLCLSPSSVDGVVVNLSLLIIYPLAFNAKGKINKAIFPLSVKTFAVDWTINHVSSYSCSILTEFMLF